MEIDKINIAKKLEKLSKKMRNKKVIIYGAGIYFQAINEAFDLKKIFNIIGISDMKFKPEQEENGEEFLGYKIINRTNLENHDADYVLVATVEFWGIIDNFIAKSDSKKKTKYLPLVDKTFMEIFREIFN